MKTGNSKSLYGICDMGQRMLFMHIDCFLNKEAGEQAICARNWLAEISGQPGAKRARRA
jgi:hypothetical protein